MNDVLKMFKEAMENIERATKDDPMAKAKAKAEQVRKEMPMQEGESTVHYIGRLMDKEGMPKSMRVFAYIDIHEVLTDLKADNTKMTLMAVLEGDMKGVTMGAEAGQWLERNIVDCINILRTLGVTVETKLM